MEGRQLARRQLWPWGKGRQVGWGRFGYARLSLSWPDIVSPVGVRGRGGGGAGASMFVSFLVCSWNHLRLYHVCLCTTKTPLKLSSARGPKGWANIHILSTKCKMSAVNWYRQQTTYSLNFWRVRKKYILGAGSKTILNRLTVFKLTVLDNYKEI